MIRGRKNTSQCLVEKIVIRLPPDDWNKDGFTFLFSRPTRAGLGNPGWLAARTSTTSPITRPNIIHLE